MSESRPAVARTPGLIKGIRGAGESDGAGTLQSLCWKLSYPERERECLVLMAAVQTPLRAVGGSNKGTVGSRCGLLFSSVFLPSLALPLHSSFFPPPSISSSSSILLSSLLSHKRAPSPSDLYQASKQFQLPPVSRQVQRCGSFAGKVARVDGVFQAWEREPRREEWPSHQERPELKILASPLLPLPPPQLTEWGWGERRQRLWALGEQGFPSL